MDEEAVLANVLKTMKTQSTTSGTHNLLGDGKTDSFGGRS